MTLLHDDLMSGRCFWGTGRITQSPEYSGRKEGAKNRGE
jgi:hypothetical protein